MSNQPAFFLQGARRLHETTEQEIEDAQQRLSLRFPVFLKNYYRLYDTMPIRECNFELDGHEFCLCALVTIAPGGLSMDSLFECAYFQNRVPKGWIPIGLDLSGDYYFYEPLTKMVLLHDQYTDDYVIAGFDLPHFFTELDNSLPTPPEEDGSTEETSSKDEGSNRSIQ